MWDGGGRVHGSVNLHFSLDEWDARVGCGRIHGPRTGSLTGGQREVLVPCLPRGKSIKDVEEVIDGGLGRCIAQET